ncbi:MAG: tetratricopeptide repeat protein, partial [Myxococcota bacterium]
QALYYYSETRRLAPDHPDAYLQAARLIRGADATEAAKLAEAAVELDPSSVEARLLVARLALFRGDEATALKAAERLLVIAPDDPDAHLVLAATLQQQAGRERREEAPDPALLERALAAADRALELSEPNDRWRVLVRRAELLGAWPGREGEAAPVYRAALEATSTRDSTIAVGRAALEYARRQEDAALRAWVLGRIVEAAPNWIRAWEELARLEEEAGGSAEAVYRRMLEADAEEAVAHAAWARFLAREGREAEAAAHLEQTADAGVAPAELLGTLADLHFQQGRREEAVQVVRRLESEHPGAPATERARAQQRIRDGRLAEAETLLRTLPDAQEDAEVLRLLATTLLRQGRPTEALAAAERALELAPGYGRAAALRARIRARTGDWLGVARDLRMVALRSRRLQPGERVLMGRALYELHRPDAAARVLEPLTSGEELFVPAALELARQRADDEPDAAREVLERAHERAPRHPEVLAMLASLDLRAGDAAAARDRLDAAIAEDADAPEVLLTRARLLAYQGDLPEATKDARRAFEAQPGRPEAALLLTKLLGSQGRVGEAIAALDAADEADSLAPRSRLVLARLHAAEGNEARARALLEELHANHPSLPGLANDLAFLVASEGEDLERARALAGQAVEE